MLPSWVEPELATLTSARFWSRDWMYERKLDGERCLAFVEGATVRLLTRNKKPVTSTYPEARGCAQGHARGQLHRRR